MRSIRNRLSALEKSAQSSKGKHYPRWEAIALLEMCGECRRAAWLYESSDLEGLRELFDQLLEIDCKTSYRERDRDRREMDWAVDEVGRLLPEWKASEWWEDATLRLFEPHKWLIRWLERGINHVNAGRIVLTHHYRMNGGQLREEISNFLWVPARCSLGLEADEAEATAQKVTTFLRWAVNDGETWPQTIAELREWIEAQLEGLRNENEHEKTS